MRTPGVIDNAIAALTLEARSLDSRCVEHLWPSDPYHQREGFCLSVATFMEAKDKLSILLMCGCDWYFWARLGKQMQWKKEDVWVCQNPQMREHCGDCAQETFYGSISLPTGVFLCLACKDALDRAKEAPCSLPAVAPSSPASSG